MHASTPPLIWEPSDHEIEQTNLARFLDWLTDERGLSFARRDYEALWHWSTTETDTFWRAIWDYFDVQADGDPTQVMAIRAMPGAQWFPQTSLNHAEHIFRGKDPSQLAIIAAGESGQAREISWGELHRQTAQIAGGLRALGVEKGDRVVAYMPNIPETIAAFLAVASLGAIWSSCSPDFGVRSVVDRFAQIEPKVLLAVDGYRYGGRQFDKRDVVAELERQMPTLQHTVVLPSQKADPDLSELRSGISWGDLLVDGQDAALTFTRVPFDHPLWVLYSSGTTGLPKAIVHGHGGILLEHFKKLHLHLDARPGDRVFWFTTTGWMMWNFLVGVLLTDAAIVLYDGNPGHPDLGRLWDLAQETGMTCFGTSASFIASCMKAGVEPARGRDLSRLRSVGSTGSPLSPEGFQWVADELGSDKWLFSTSGGTDVCTAFVGGVPTLPVHRGELQARALGAAVAAFDDAGQPLIGEVGELVITQPMPSMPVAFWNDEDGSRLRESYFEMYPGVWRHGDWIEITERGSAVIYGRSDSTINRGGIRMGTAEIYRAVLALPQISDALVVDVPREGEENWMPLFVALAPDVQLDDELTAAIARRVRADCSPRHVPSEVIAVAQIPRTLSGKVLEVPVKRILMGVDPAVAASRDSLANPAALDWFAAFARQRTPAL